ncbi:MAG: adenine-specific methyltransferase EcoRI family protein [Paludibacteraceae bacterium]|nr:adenine-specific methyltransferase EcoRI family protein [Paludibacteraceae bacterium]MBQ9426971.1 adenine-specific methyltransferase EcoRI family protein [Paludibacteraceae bacterium]
MANNNTLLGAAKASKKDEFYTQLSDIEKELVHYRAYFRDKIVFCNCDDPYESNFFKYFALNFNALGLKKLIATCYDGSPIAQQELPLFEDEDNEPKKKAYKVEISEVPDMDGNGATDLTDVQLLLKSSNHNVKAELKGNGDFRSQECIELLKQADIVVTNPPFSLFREFISLLTKYNKDFIVIGNTNSLTYREVFQLIKDNKLRTGYTNFNVGMFFIVPDSYEQFHHYQGGKKVARVSSSCWLTTMPVRKHNEEIICIKQYNKEEFPTYDNFDAIEVGNVNDIPYDYDGIMGVPITYINKHNPNQFEIIGSFNNSDVNKKEEEGYVLSKNTPTIINGKEALWNGPVINKQPLYKRICIRKIKIS